MMKHEKAKLAKVVRRKKISLGREKKEQTALQLFMMINQFPSKRVMKFDLRGIM
jgi:hypothetical protein